MVCYHISIDSLGLQDSILAISDQRSVVNFQHRYYRDREIAPTRKLFIFSALFIEKELL